MITSSDILFSKIFSQKGTCQPVRSLVYRGILGFLHCPFSPKSLVKRAFKKNNTALCLIKLRVFYHCYYDHDYTHYNDLNVT